jgi:VWA domain containing CoxE-like protein/AAA domain (dynein-related subfamily)
MTDGGGITDVDGLAAALDRTDHLADDALATALFLAVRLRQPILLEGEPRVGKTSAAVALAAALDTPLLRVHRLEGLAAAEALYEWNYPRQLLAIRLAEARGIDLTDADLFTEDYLLARPLLAAITHPGPGPAVLLVDEVDRADDEFEAFLFEALAESAVTIPELGTRRAAVAPVVVLTSNHTRRPARRSQAPLPLPLDRLSRPGAGRGDRAAPRAGGGGLAARPRRHRGVPGHHAAALLVRPGHAGSDPAQIPVLDAVFDGVFRGSDPPVFRGDPNAPLLHDDPPVAPVARGGEGGGGPARVGGGTPSGSDAAPSEVPVPVLASAAERLGGREFDALSPAELARLAGAMRALRVATPVRRSRRTRGAAHGDRLDLRRTLRSVRRTAGDPVALARRRCRLRPRRFVVLCDISGSMAPYARALIQLLYCAAGAERLDLRHPDQADQGALALQPLCRAGPGGAARAGLVGRHAHRGGAAPVQRRVRAARAGAVRWCSSCPTGGRPVTRGCCAGKWPACGRWRTGSSGPTPGPGTRTTGPSPAAWRRRGRTSTRW